MTATSEKCKNNPEDNTMAKTVEELEAELLESKKSIEATTAKNKELLDEMKKERRKNSENSTDMEAFYKLQDKYDTLKDEKTKLEHEFGKANKTVEKLTATNEALTGDFTKLVVDDGLTNQLAKAGVKPEYMEATKALLRDKVSLSENKAMVGDKPLNEFMTEWVTTDGKAFIAAPENGGGGSQGGGGSGGATPKEGTREAEIARAKELIEKR